MDETVRNEVIMFYRRSFGAAGLLGLLLVACSSAPPTPAPVALPSTSAVATEAVAPTEAVVPTEALAPTQAPAAPVAPTAPAVPASGSGEFITPEGYHGLGMIDAPVTIVMYSDVF